MREPHDNALRYEPGGPGHVESYFIRGNAPDRRLSFWLKATVFAPRRDSAVAELWGIFFDGENDRIFSEKRTVPFGLTSFDGEPLAIAIAGAEFFLGGDGEARGELHGEAGRCGWGFTWKRTEGPLGEPLCLLPSEKMIDGAFPRSTPLTPLPSVTFDGAFEVFGESVDITGWTGMQGHNWGREHAFEYAWGQCPFLDEGGEPFCWVEGFSGKIRIGGRPTPFISAMVVRRGDREYRFDRLVDLWRQEADVLVDDYTWNLKLKSADGEAALSMVADPDEMVCLGYHNPDGRLSYCLNSKMSRVKLQVNPVNEAGFQCESPHGGALEFLRNSPDLRFSRVV